jgi:hypothetical protein
MKKSATVAAQVGSCSHLQSIVSFTHFSDPSFISETSFVRAPLNSRVGPNTSLPKAKGKAKADSLHHIPLDIQEALILEDLLNVLMECYNARSLCLHY